MAEAGVCSSLLVSRRFRPQSRSYLREEDSDVMETNCLMSMPKIERDIDSRSQIDGVNQPYSTLEIADKLIEAGLYVAISLRIDMVYV